LLISAYVFVVIKVILGQKGKAVSDT